MEEISKETIQERAPKNYYLLVSIVLLIVVVSITGFLYLINTKIDKKIQETDMSIGQHTLKISELKNSDEIAAYDIIKSSKQDIEKNINNSIVSKYITEFVNVSRKYKTFFNGFSFDGEKINTQATYVNKDPNLNAIDGVSSFIMEFRTGKSSLFSLGPISSVSGDVFKRAFNVSFKISR